MSRFARTELLLGESAMEQLREATVVVCGLGAVGSYATEALARCGVGTLRLVDFDVVARETVATLLGWDADDSGPAMG
jgi:tRNA A37 threonylcarbamoyladenosine dehydratase